MLEPHPPSKRGRPLRELSWVGLFLGAGALAAGVVLGPWRADDADVVDEPTAAAPIAASPATERRNLLAAATKAAAAASRGEPAANEPARPAEHEQRARPSAAAAPVTAARSATARSFNAALRSSRPVSVAPPRRKRPTRAEPPAEVPTTDSELDGLFTSPASTRASGPDPRAAGPGELEGLFPMDEPVTVRANGAPLPD